MLKRFKLCPQGMLVTQLAFGCLPCRLSETGKWFAMLDHYYAAGGNLFDTSRMYGAGESEQVLGAWLQDRGARGNSFIITKIGHGGSNAILPDADFEEMVARELDASLAALRTERVDLLLLHRDNPAVEVGRIIERLNHEVKSGRVGCLGASNWTYARVDEANAYARLHDLAGFAVVSNHLSLAQAAEPFYARLVNVDAAGEAWHAHTGIPLLSWSAQARGFFTGAYDSDKVKAEDAFGQRMLQVYGSSANYARLARAQVLGRDKGGYSATEVALAWLL
ncbi:MAG: aldo/keto reductase, partial [Anaerolineae bacterium]